MNQGILIGPPDPGWENPWRKVEQNGKRIGYVRNGEVLAYPFPLETREQRTELLLSLAEGFSQ